MVFRRTPRSRFARPLSLHLLEAREVPTVSTFQNGVASYTGTHDTYINAASPNTTYGTTTTIAIANPSTTLSQTQGLLRFDNIIGNGAGQIPAGSIIVSASLTLNTTTGGDGATFHRMLVPWTESTTYNKAGSGTGSFNSTTGIQLGSITTGEALNTYFANAGDPSTRVSDPATGSDSFGVTDDIQAWANGATNYGWLLNPITNSTTATSTWAFSSSETATVSARPQLSIVWIPATNVSTAVFQQGTNGYTGTLDTKVSQPNPATNYNAATTTLFSDGESTITNDVEQVGLRFDNIFGSAAGQVPSGATIIGATLTLASNVSNGRGNGGRFYRFTQNYDFTTLTWNNTVSGAGFKIGTDTQPGYQSAAGPTPKPESGLNAFDVTNDIGVWAKGTEPNYGWAIIPFDGGSDGWGIQSSESAVPTVNVNDTTPQAFNPRPKLTIYYTAPGIEPPAAQLDVTNGVLTYTGGSAVANNVSISLAGGNYSVSDPADTITLSANAQAAGWTVTNNVATGPASSVSAGLTLSTGSSVDTITLGDVSVPVNIDGGNNAGDNVVFNGAINVTGGKIVVDRVTGISQASNTTITVGTLTLTADTIGAASAPLTVNATSISFTGVATGASIITTSGSSVSGTGASNVSITNLSGTLTVSNKLSTASGNITISSADGLAVNADITTAGGLITLAANTDGADSQGYSQSTTARLLSSTSSPSAVSISVNTATGGTGNAVLGQSSLSATATVTVNSNAGSILWNPGFAIPAINASNALVLAAGGATFLTSGVDSSVGTADSPIQTSALNTSITGLTSAKAGTGGVYITEWNGSTGYFTATAQGAGNIQIIAANAGGNNLYVAPAGITTGSGSITLLADDDLRVYGPIGGSGFSGKIYLEANRDGGNNQQFQQYEDSNSGFNGIIQTTNASSDALVIRTYPTSTSTSVIGGIVLGNITIGPGGTAVFDAGALLNAGTGNDTVRAGTIVQNLGAKIDTGTGTVYLNAKDNPIGIAVSQPINVIASKVIAGTNSNTTSSSSLGLNQPPGNINIVSAGSTSYQAQTSTAGTNAGTVYLATTTGTLTVDGTVRTDSGSVTLLGGTAIVLNADVGGSGESGDISLTSGSGGITQTAGQVRTTGKLDLTPAGPSVFSGTGNSASSVNLNTGSLYVNGSFTANTVITAADSTTLGGSGTLGKVFVNGSATLDIGGASNTPGVLTFNTLTLQATNGLPVQVNGKTAGSGYDQLTVTGGIDLGGAKLSATLGGSYSPVASDVLTLVKNNSTVAITGTFDSLPEGTTFKIGTVDYTISYIGGDGNDVTLTPQNVAAGDTIAPTATATLPGVTTRNGTTAAFTINYADDTAVNAATIANGTVTVTGPNGFSTVATLGTVTPAGNGSPLVASYTFAAPGGKFDVQDNGTYTVTLGGTVADTTGNAVVTGSLGNFAVAAPVGVAQILAVLPDGTATSLTTAGTQRSRIPALRVVFDGVATGADQTTAFSLVSAANGQAVSYTLVSQTVGNHTEATLTFAGGLANGRYTFTLSGTQIGTANTAGFVGLDGNNDGTAGGDYVLGSNLLFRIYGDADGSGAVDAQDVTAFLNTYGTSLGNSAYRSYLDADGSGAVDAQDVTAFLNTYGSSI